MAELILSPVIDNLVTILKDEVSMLRGVEDEIQALSQTLALIQGFVSDAENKQCKSAERAVKIWLRQLQDVAYKAENIIEHFTFEQRLKEINQEGVSQPTKVRKINFQSSLAWLMKQVPAVYHTGTSLKKTNEELQNILRLGSQLNLNSRVHGEKNSTSVKRPPTGPCMTEPVVYGRDEDKQNIIDMLMMRGGDESGGAQEHHDVPVIAIVGIGGIGKTTLAQLVYNDVNVHDKFNLKVWICVSEEFDVARLTKLAIECITGKECKLSNIGSLQSKLQQLIKGLKYLLVMDDVWNEDFQKWDMFVAPLRQCNAPGSKILVTTRKHQVPHAMRIRNPYALEVLSDDDCWSLFQQRAFALGEAERLPKLVEIGKEIVNKCGGIPLVAKALGALLFSSKEEKYWLRIKNEGISRLSHGDQSVLSVLRFSYDHLPSHLKQCFVYCSLYPKDTVIEVEDLIWQWMAHGYIQQSGDTPMEDLGYEYFNELLWMSFFQDITGRDNHMMCKMHDIIHDLAQLVAGYNYLAITNSKSIQKTISKSIHHLNVLCDVVPSFDKLDNLRTLLIGGHHPNMTLDQMLSNLKYLRVLRLSNGEVELLDSIGNLRHLQYLDIGKPKGGTLPNSMSNLLNLQTLRIRYDVIELPRDISRLKRLRHLDCSLTRMPPKIGQLTCLCTLHKFIVSKDEGCRIDELGGSDILGGNLEIRKLENVSNGDEAKLAKLIGKQHLRGLELWWTSGVETQNPEHVLEGLLPHQNLRRLRIYNYPGENSPSWLIGTQLSHLVELVLVGWEGCKTLRLSFHSPLLKTVHLQMNALRCLELSLNGCTSIELLYVCEMIDLVSLSQVLLDGYHSVSFLKKLKFYECPKLKSISSLDLESLEISNCLSLISLPIVSSLKHLSLSYCYGITVAASIKNLTSLHSLELIGIWDLTCLELENHSFLQNLVITTCEDLTEVEFKTPTPLKCLKIASCGRFNHLSQIRPQNLICLEELRLISLLQLTHLPTEILCLPHLQYLEIFNCLKLHLTDDQLPCIDRNKVKFWNWKTSFFSPEFGNYLL